MKRNLYLLFGIVAAGLALWWLNRPKQNTITVNLKPAGDGPKIEIGPDLQSVIDEQAALLGISLQIGS